MSKRVRLLAGSYLVLLCVLLTVVTLLPQTVLAAVTYNFVGITSDGYLYLSGSDFATVQAATSGESVNDQASYIKLGMNNTTGTYSVYRSALFFDTSGLPDDATISSAKLKIYGYSDNEAEAGNKIYVVSGAELGAPLNDSGDGHYATILDAYDEGSRGEFTLSGWSTSAYNEITLTTAGKSDINTSGYTKFGLLTKNDVDGTAPSTAEYVEFWSFDGNSAYTPLLEVTYTVPSLGTPINFSVTEARVYTDYVNGDDQLYVFMADVTYASTPIVPPEENFIIQLLDDSTVVGQVPLLQWGFRPGAIYLAPENALDFTHTISIKIVNIDDSDINTSYILTADDWKGISDPGIKNWARQRAAEMEERDGVSAGTYVSDDFITDAGQVLFSTGIPGIAQCVPTLFANPNYYLDPEPNTDVVENIENKWGTNFQTAMTNFSNDFLHIPDEVGTPILCSFLFILLPLGASIGVLGQTQTGGSVGLVLAAVLLIFFTMQGMIPIITLVILLVFVVLIAVYLFVMKG